MSTFHAEFDGSRNPLPGGSTSPASTRERQDSPLPRPTSRAEFAADGLAELARAASPGTKIGTKLELRSRLDVSLGTFNEALRLVQARGIVAVRPGPGGGLFASEPSPIARFGNAVLRLDSESAPVADAVRIRSALEGLIVEDALTHASASDIAAMRIKLDQMRSAVLNDDGLEFLHTNWSLHLLIAATTPNHLLQAMYSSLLDIVESHTTSIFARGEQPLDEFHLQRHQIHVEIVDAIEAGDRAAAAAAVERHNSTFADRS